MLADTALPTLKPKSTIYKACDRNGMYVAVSPASTRHLPVRLPYQTAP